MAASMPTAATTRTLRPASVTAPPASKISPPLLRPSLSCVECVASARVHSTDTPTAAIINSSTLWMRPTSARTLPVTP
eukprot:2499847-Pyramimonas_sp.AAC.1